MPIYDAGVGFAQVGADVASTLSNLETNRAKVQADDASHRLRENTANALNNPDSIEARVDAAEAQNQTISANQAKQATFNAFDRYIVDFQPRHLNQLIKDEPLVKQALGNVVAIERIDPTVDAGLLNKFDIPLDKFDPRWHVKTIGPNGEVGVQKMDELLIGTGYTRYKDNRELDYLIKQKQLLGKGKDFAPGAAEKDANFYAEQGVEDGDLGAISQGLYNDRTQGNIAGQLEAADEVQDKMMESFGGEDGYYATDMSIHKNRVKASRNIRKIEALAKIDFSGPDRADIKDINTIVATAGIAADKITPEVTGALDTILRTAAKYVSNSAEIEDIDKVSAASAYAAFRNTVRHGLYGSALTATEVSSFNEAFGTLSQKYPAVISQFKTALMQVRSKLQTIYESNDPVLAHYYMGKNASNMDNMIRALDERLELFNKTGSIIGNSTPGDTGGTVDKPDRDLNSILGPIPEATE